MLDAGQPGRLAGREAEHDAGERLEDQVLRAVGEHRDEDEDGEAPRLGLGPDLGSASRKPRCGPRARPRLAAARPSMPQTASSESTNAAPHTTAVTATRRAGENGSRSRPASAGGDREAGDHHEPDDRRRGARAVGLDPLGQQRQERGAGGADAEADQR